jgi:hypothetical protein
MYKFEIITDYCTSAAPNLQHSYKAGLGYLAPSGGSPQAHTYNVMHGQSHSIFDVQSTYHSAQPAAVRYRVEV